MNHINTNAIENSSWEVTRTLTALFCVAWAALLPGLFQWAHAVSPAGTIVAVTVVFGLAAVLAFIPAVLGFIHLMRPIALAAVVYAVRRSAGFSYMPYHACYDLRSWMYYSWGHSTYARSKTGLQSWTEHSGFRFFGLEILIEGTGGWQRTVQTVIKTAT